MQSPEGWSSSLGTSASQRFRQVRALRCEYLGIAFRTHIVRTCDISGREGRRVCLFRPTNITPSWPPRGPRQCDFKHLHPTLPCRHKHLNVSKVVGTSEVHTTKHCATALRHVFNRSKLCTMPMLLCCHWEQCLNTGGIPILLHLHESIKSDHDFPIFVIPFRIARGPSRLDSIRSYQQSLSFSTIGRLRSISG